MIELEVHAEGVVLPVRARAGARRNAIEGEHDGALKVSVTQPPEKGKANQAITAQLAKELSLRKSQIRLVSGETSTRKRFLIAGIERAELARRLARF